MSLRERIRRAVEGVPDEGAVTLPAGVLRRWLEEGQDGTSEPASEGRGADIVDLTVGEIAEALDKSESTIRGWMPDVPGSYKLGGGWRISRDDWRAYLDSLADPESNGADPQRVRSRPGSDLADWREERSS